MTPTTAINMAVGDAYMIAAVMLGSFDHWGGCITMIGFACIQLWWARRMRERYSL